MQIAIGMFLGITLLLMLQRLLRGYIILSAPTTGPAKKPWTSHTAKATGSRTSITEPTIGAFSDYGEAMREPVDSAPTISEIPSSTSPSPTSSTVSQVVGENGAVSQDEIMADAQGFLDAANRVSTLLAAVAAPRQQSIARRVLHFLK